MRQEAEPATDEVTEVAPNVLRSQLPISMPGLGHVNMYMLLDDKGAAVVDPGVPGDESWNALLVRLGKPYARSLQRRFARDSLAAMRRACGAAG